MRSKYQAVFFTWRFYLVLLCILVAAIGLTFRVFDLAILDQHFLRQQGDERVLRLINTPALRGMLLDRNGFPLAVSTTVYSIWANPQEFSPSKHALNKLAELINMKPKEILSLVESYKIKKREFVYLKRALSPDVDHQIKLLFIPGLYSHKTYRRYYPEGEMAAHVVGFTNIDDQGQEGLELGLNSWLSGKPGKKWVIKDRLGRVISDVHTVTEQTSGHDLALSIDRRIQYLAYRELLSAVIDNRATSGSVVVLDVNTGEVLAMVNQPSFNPNNRLSQLSDRLRNRALTDTFEPGSTIKAFTVASALESGKFKPTSRIDTSPGFMRVGHNVVKDEKNNGLLSMMEILEVSSNVGAAKMVLSLPSDQFLSLLQRVGFGEITAIGFPGEQSGFLLRNYPLGPFKLATLSFGYGLTVTALQLAVAYSVLANQGMKVPVTLIRANKAPLGTRVMDAKVAKEMLDLLESGVAKGTGKLASVPGYRVAGKSGTAKLVGEGGYQKHHYNSSFVGIAPASNPRLVVAVVIHDPQGKNYYGGIVSRPVFAKIMEGTLRILDVPPDAT